MYLYGIQTHIVHKLWNLFGREEIRFLIFWSLDFFKMVKMDPISTVFNVFQKCSHCRPFHLLLQCRQGRGTSVSSPHLQVLAILHDSCQESSKIFLVYHSAAVRREIFTRLSLCRCELVNPHSHVLISLQKFNRSATLTWWSFFQ